MYFYVRIMNIFIMTCDLKFRVIQLYYTISPGNINRKLVQIFGSKLFLKLEIFIQKSCVQFAKVILIIGVSARKIWGGVKDYFARMFVFNSLDCL